MSAPRVLYLVKICRYGKEFSELVERYGFYEYLDFVYYYLRFGRLRNEIDPEKWCDGYGKDECVNLHGAFGLEKVDPEHFYLAVSVVVREGNLTRVPIEEDYVKAFKEGRIIDMHPQLHLPYFLAFKELYKKFFELRQRVAAAIGCRC